MKSIIVLCLVVFPIAVFGADIDQLEYPEDRVKADIKKGVCDLYDSNTSRLYMLKKNIEIYEKVRELPADGEYGEILKKAVSEHYPNFSVIIYIYEHEIKAYEELKKR